MSKPLHLDWLRPSAVKLSASIHGTALVGTALAPSLWGWSLGAVLANHALLAGATLCPRNPWFGPNLRYLPAAAVARREIALTLDDGPDPKVTPQVLDLLDTTQTRASFFCVAERAMRAPALVREMVARGHSIENHSYRHPNLFSTFGPARIAREVGEAQARLSDLAGVAPQFFRPPAGFANPFLHPVLESLNLRMANWSRRGFDTRDTQLPRVLSRLTQGLAAGDILLAHDGNSPCLPQGEAFILTLLPALIQAMQAQGLRGVSLPQALRSDLPPREPA